MMINSAHSSKFAIAEVIFGLPLIFGILLQFLVPISVFPEGAVKVMTAVAGLVFILAGLVVIFLVRTEFRRNNQPTDPGSPTTKLIKTGIFGISRNPMYLGASLFFLGIGLSFTMVWVLAMFVPALVLCRIFLISPEERYLRQLFPNEYTGYESSVRRWIGKK